MRVVEVDPGMTDLPVLHFHHRAAVIDRLSPRSRDVCERTAMRPGRAPPNDDVAIASRQDLLDVEVEVGKRGQI